MTPITPISKAAAGDADGKLSAGARLLLFLQFLDLIELIKAGPDERGPWSDSNASSAASANNRHRAVSAQRSHHRSQ